MSKSKQLVSFVLDNSASVSREKLSALMSGFRALLDEQDNFPQLEWELLTYDAFVPSVVKTFDAQEIDAVYAGRMPLLGRAVEMAANRLMARAEETVANGEEIYRPLLFILSDGFTFDDPQKAVEMLEELERAEKMAYLPFKLCPKLHAERVQKLDRVKHMITVKEGCIPQFFGFLQALLVRRFASEDNGLKFQKNDFEGWAEL